MIHKIVMPDGQEIVLTINGQIGKASKAVIFCHGFGAGMDNRGLFSEIMSALGDEYLYVRFTYDRLEAHGVRAMPLSIQAAIIHKIVEFVRGLEGIESIVAISHSMGGAALAIACPDISKAILLAPPPEPFFERFLSNFGGREGAIINLNADSHIPRSDRSTTIIGANFWPELEALIPVEHYHRLSKLSKMRLWQDNRTALY